MILACLKEYDLENEVRGVIKSSNRSMHTYFNVLFGAYLENYQHELSECDVYLNDFETELTEGGAIEYYIPALDEVFNIVYETLSD